MAQNVPNGSFGTPVAVNNDYPGANDPLTKNNRARVAGSGFTVFTWNGKIISFARQISHQSARPVGQGVVPIHPLDSPYPVQLVTPQALTMGTLVLEMYELYGQNIWQRLDQLDVRPADKGPVDLAGIFHAVASSDPIHIYRIVQPPVAFGQSKAYSAYSEEYHNCVVSSAENGETIEIGSMEVLKQITVNYTHLTQGGYNSLLVNSSISGFGPPPGAA